MRDGPVCSAELLPEHHNETSDESIACPGQEAFPPGNTFGGVQLLFDGCADLSQLFDNLWAIHGLASDVGQRLGGFAVATLLHQPPRRFFQEEQTAKHHASGDKLDSNRHAPLLGGYWNAKGYTIVQPIGKCRTDDQELLEETGDTSTYFSRCILRDKDRSDGRHATDTQASNDTTGIDHTDFMVCCSLDGCTDEKDDGEEHERVTTTKALVQVCGSNRTEEASGGQERYNVGRDGRILVAGETRSVGRKAKVFFESLQRENAAHDSSVITCKD